MHKLNFFLTSLIFLVFLSGCETIKKKTDTIVEKENERLSKFIGKSSSDLQIHLGKYDEDFKNEKEYEISGVLRSWYGGRVYFRDATNRGRKIHGDGKQRKVILYTIYSI